MELNKQQIKNLVDNINWEIDNPEDFFNIVLIKKILDKSLIDYE